VGNHEGLYTLLTSFVWLSQVQKEYRKQIYRAAWLPESVRMKYGKTTGTVAATTVPNQTSSSTGKLNVSNYYCCYTELS